LSFLDNMLGRKHPPMIGLDISSSSVKLVELGRAPSGEYVLERFASESFEKGWIPTDRSRSSTKSPSGQAAGDQERARRRARS
jgi:hypothetical protein